MKPASVEIQSVAPRLLHVIGNWLHDKLCSVGFVGSEVKLRSIAHAP